MKERLIMDMDEDENQVQTYSVSLSKSTQREARKLVGLVGGLHADADLKMHSPAPKNQKILFTGESHLIK